jgi:hypothetical protein
MRTIIIALVFTAAPTLCRAQQPPMDQFLEEMKRSNPDKYKEIMQSRAVGEKVGRILEKFHKGGLPDADARRQLQPLVREGLQRWIDALPKCRAEMEKKLAFLKQVEAQPDVLVQQHVDALLSTQEEGKPDLDADRSAMGRPCLPPPPPGRVVPGKQKGPPGSPGPEPRPVQEAR